MALFTLSYDVPTDRALSIRLSDLEFAHNSLFRSANNEEWYWADLGEGDGHAGHDTSLWPPCASAADGCGRPNTAPGRAHASLIFAAFCFLCFFFFLVGGCVCIARLWRQLGCSVAKDDERTHQGADSDHGVRVVPQLHRRMSVTITHEHMARPNARIAICRRVGTMEKAARRRGARLTSRFLCFALCAALCSPIHFQSAAR